MVTILLLLLSIGLIILATTRFRIHPFLALLAASLFFGIFSEIKFTELVGIINEGFGSTIGNIGIVIIAGIIIGTFLEKSGGAMTLASSILKLVGPKRLHTAMALIGYVVSIPVFADSGFIILSSLNKALARKAAVPLAGTTFSLVFGLAVTHTMVPPTPGPIAAAGIINADLGLVILIGGLTALLTLIPGIWFAKTAGKKLILEKQVIPEPLPPDEERPGMFKSFLPIVVPIILILSKSVADFPGDPLGTGPATELIRFVGNPVVALLIGMLLSFLLPKTWSKTIFSSTGWVGEALVNAALIIMITGAGGAFGKVLQASELGQLISENAGLTALGLWMPFLIAAGLKSAQGSSTVAIITTASIIAPLLPAMGLDAPVDKAMSVVAIGAGSLVVSHANDSMFWIVTQMYNMSVRQGYYMQSLGFGVIGFSAMVILTVIHWLSGVL